MTDDGNPKDADPQSSPTQPGAGPAPERGTVAPAVGGTKTDPDETGPDATDQEPDGDPPGNAGGKSTNNPDVGPSS